MLPDGTIPGSLADLLVVFRFCFTAHGRYAAGDGVAFVVTARSLAGVLRVALITANALHIAADQSGG
jgi:hypothetical protein